MLGFSYILQYFLPFAREGINNQIEMAILRADRLGVKVISLAALNKVGICFLFTWASPLLPLSRFFCCKLEHS